jgi:DsbC/DsbD-like thiol-disulfide interchange protein
VLAGFAAKHGIAYPLLSDEWSQAIRALGLFNEHVYEHHAVYGIPQQEHHWGVPYPGSFLLDEQGYVMQKRFEQSYRERETGVGMLEQGFGIKSAVHGAEARAHTEGVEIRAYLDSTTYRFFQRLWLTVELTIAPGLHVYGQPIPAGFMPLVIEVTPITGVVVGTPRLPSPHPSHLDGLDEDLFVYEGQVTVSVPLTFIQEGDEQTVHVTIRHQACTATGCLRPSGITLSLSVRAADLIERPRRR